MFRITGYYSISPAERRVEERRGIIKLIWFNVASNSPSAFLLYDVHSFAGK